MTEALQLVDEPKPRNEDKDSLHILPLSILPLRTPALGKARLIKNSRLESVVELFCGDQTGSGQVPPERLHRSFDFSAGNADDLKLIRSLSKLASYDVYSLRLELRRLGICVDDHASLQLSDQKVQELSQYMSAFIRPLIDAVYGTSNIEIQGYPDLINLFSDPNIAGARKNLGDLAKRLEIDLTDLPSFLQDYADVYLSLAYYQYCLDENLPKLGELFDTMEEIEKNPHFRSNFLLIDKCAEVKQKLDTIAIEIGGILDIFQVRTLDMWHDMTADGFQQMNGLVKSYQTHVGGSLCAITVKMNAWSKAFPVIDARGLSYRADFIMNEMWDGLQSVQPIRHADLG